LFLHSKQKKTDTKAGIIIGGEFAKPIMFPNLSRVILLTNMVGKGEVDGDLKTEIEQECQKFGKVDKCIVHQDLAPLTPDDESVRIFVRFSAPESATKGIASLNGRFFAGHAVSARYYNEEMFSREQLDFFGT